jgi:hypothetical protein
MSRIHLRHDVDVGRFLDALVEAAASEGADRGKVRDALRECISKYMRQADICGIFSNCDDVKLFDPFVKIPD